MTMGKYEIQGTATPHSGPDEDFLDFDIVEYPGHADLVGVTGLLDRSRPGVGYPDWTVYDGAEEETTEGECFDWFKKEMAEWRKESGKTWPPVFRVKISIESEALNDVELEAYWKAKQEVFRARHDDEGKKDA